MNGWAAEAELVVVGTGVAGLTAAVEAARLGVRVVVVTKDAPDAGSTRWAQGGVAVVMGDMPGDSVAAHVADTLTAGAGLCDEASTAAILRGGPEAVARLRARGAAFDADGDRLARTREGGHSAFRVIHAGGDATGAEIERTLVRAAAGLPLLAGHVAVDVLADGRGRVAGLAVLDEAGQPGVLHTQAVLLATGGYGQLYASTTNPATATGDGVALALRAGAAAADLEFVQFHPTVLYTGPTTGRRPLVTEAVRGEGAVLLDRAGRRFLTGVHPLADLAPRDVVAAAITRRMAETADRLRLPRRPRARRLRRTLPDGLRGLPGRRDRPGARADPGDARGALRLRRRGHRPRRADGGPGAVRRGRGRAHRAARGQPAGVQQPAGGPGDRGTRGARGPAGGRRRRGTPPSCRKATFLRLGCRKVTFLRWSRPRRPCRSRRAPWCRAR